MKFGILFAAAFVTLLLQTQPSSDNLVQGVVTARKDSQPLSGVTVTLAQSVTAPMRTTQTDALGHFTFATVALGHYTVRTELQGYSESLVQWDVDPKRPQRSLSIALTHTVVISGRISDPNGQPAAGITVEALQLLVSSGQRSWSYPAATVQTNIRGEYRLFGLNPGTYYVRYVPSFIASANTAVGRAAASRPNAQDSYAITYFPGKANGNLASPLVLDDGSEIANTNFGIQPGANATISGIVSPANPGQLVPAVSVIPNSPDAIQSPRDFVAIRPISQTPGGFEIRGVPPGSYTLYAVRDTRTDRLAGKVSVTTDGLEIADVVIDLKPWGVALTCHVTFISAEAGANPPKQVFGRIQIRDGPAIPQILLPSGFGQRAADARGDFPITGVAPGSYDLLLFPSTSPTYVADIRQDDLSVFDSGIQVGTTPVAVEVIIKSDGGTIEGTLMGTDKKPMPDSTVVLVPPPSRRQNQTLFQITQTATTGNFQMHGIAPGEYKLFAGPPFDNGAYLNANVLAKYEESGQAVTVSPLELLEIQLKLATQ